MTDTRRDPLDQSASWVPERPRDYYCILEIDPAASHDAIRLAYRRLSQQFLLETGPSRNAAYWEEAWGAYVVLSNPASRKAYDLARSLNGGGHHSNGKTPVEQIPADELVPSNPLSSLAGWVKAAPIQKIEGVFAQGAFRAVADRSLRVRPRQAIRQVRGLGSHRFRQMAPQDAVVAVTSILLVAACLTWLILETPGYWCFVAALLLGIPMAFRPGVDRSGTTFKLLAVLGTVSALDYFAWRVLLINWQAWYFSVPLFVAEGFGAIHTIGLQYTLWPLKEAPLDLREDPTRLPIFALIPTVDEGPAVLEPTIRGALAARARYLEAYPHGSMTVVVCNDGLVANSPRWFEAETLAARLGVRCITRTEKGGAKAGNLEHARRVLGAHGKALIAIFDADQVAEPEFFLRTIPPLADPGVGWVQTCQYYRNLDNPVARWANDQQQLFYQVLCPQKSAVNAAFICGTNVVIRASALDGIGGLPQDSITEDFSASIQLHPRWRGVFLSGILATGLGPEDLRSYFSQQNRWATGTLQVLRAHWRDILLPWHGGLRIGQRIQYFLACTHYLSGIRDLVYVAAPLLFLLTGIPTIRGANFVTYLSHFLPYWLASQAAFWYAARGKTGVRGLAIGFGSFPVLLVSAVTVVTGRRARFTVTGKQRATDRNYRQALPHLIFAVGYAIAVVVGLIAHRSSDTFLLNVIWAIYNTMLLVGVIWLSGIISNLSLAGLLDPVRSTFRRSPVQLNPWAFRSAVIATCVISLVAVAPARSAAPATDFRIAVGTSQPQIGVYLPFEYLQSAEPRLQRELGFSFQIVGRSQDINDEFDTAWAERLRASGTQPWITLLFDEPGRPAYFSSLPSIANGVYDAQLRRWAREVRAYRYPVYVTILQHVDRNWVLSSAVTNGGIPQDAPRAWEHVQAIFRTEGARNVAWVWAPADPTHDSRYAPPASSIDLVQQSLIGGYQPEPNAWPDPSSVLTSLSSRYPSTPLLIEVYASGAPAAKASWLREVGSAVARTPHVYALVYHQGSPDPQATVAQDAAWSLASDPLSLSAMQEVWLKGDNPALASAEVQSAGSPPGSGQAVSEPPAGAATRPVVLPVIPSVVEPVVPPLAKPVAPAGLPAILSPSHHSALPAASDTQTSARPTVRGRDGEPLPRTYVVQDGDTLSGIAERVYGDAAVWPDIAAANADLRRDPNKLDVGQKVLLPARQP